MPTYAYACKDCAHRFDAVQSFADSALTTCPECQGVLRKEYGSIGVTFNGSGFYRTDSRAGAPSKDSTSGSSGDSASKTSSDSGSRSSDTSSSSSTSGGSAATKAAAGTTP